jgi:ABC-type antimicrobial peptide transport system permease subunit
VRTAGPLPGASTAIRAAIGRVDPMVPIYDSRTMRDLVGTSLARQRFAMTLFLVFSLVALVLAVIGIYGVMAYTVSQRTGEIGIRMALGARTGQVLGSVMGRGARLTAGGLLLGLAGGLLLTRVLEQQSMLFGVRSYDPVTFAGIIVLLAASAAAACLLPAVRAARLSPMTVLRTD